jgi:hypothetical protein
VAGKLEELLDMYEQAAVLDPTNLEYLRGIFLALVRKQAYPRQQQTAMKLYKATKDERYLVWSATANVLQARAAGEQQQPDERAKLLSLAQAILNRQLTANPSAAKEETLRLMLEVLAMRQSNRAALELLQGPLGERLSIPSERFRTKAALHLALGERATAAAQVSLSLSLSLCLLSLCLSLTVSSHCLSLSPCLLSLCLSLTVSSHCVSLSLCLLSLCLSLTVSSHRLSPSPSHCVSSHCVSLSLSPLTVSSHCVSLSPCPLTVSLPLPLTVSPLTVSLSLTVSSVSQFRLVLAAQPDDWGALMGTSN